MVAGKVMMDRNAPEALCDTPQSGYDETKAVIADWHGRGRNHVAITPRFAITSSPEQMEAAGALAREYPGPAHPDAPVGEPGRDRADAEALPAGRRLRRRLCPLRAARTARASSATASTCRSGRPRRLRESGSVAVFCPTSNLFLGSGLFDWRRLAARADPVRIAIATDVGGGTSYSMLRTLDEGYKVLQLQGQRLDPLQGFYRIDPRQCPGAVAAGKHRHARGGHARRPRRPRRQRHAGDAAEDGDRLQPCRGTVPPADPRRRPRHRRDLCRRQAGKERARGPPGRSFRAVTAAAGDDRESPLQPRGSSMTNGSG